MDSVQRKTAGITKSGLKAEKESDSYEGESGSQLPEKLTEFISDISSDDKQRNLLGTTGIRQLLCDIDANPVKQIASLNLTPRFLEFMKRDEEPELQLEAAWAVCNLTAESTEETNKVCDLGGVSQFIDLMKSPHEKIVDQAIWALGNIAGESHKFRDLILNQDGAKIMLEALSKATSKTYMAHGMWALSNLCRGKPKPKLEKVKDIIPFAINVLQTETKPETLVDAAWALSYLSEQSTDNQNVIPMGAIPLLLKHLDSDSVQLLSPCIRTLGSIIAETENQTSMLLHIPEIIPKLCKLLSHNKKTIRKEICWILSNITAGTSEQIELIISNHDHIKKLVEIAKADSPEVAKEAFWALSNAASGCNFPQAMQLFNHGALDAFLEVLNNSNTTMVILGLEGIDSFLKKGQTVAQGDQTNVFAEAVEEKGGLDLIETLQTHASQDVYHKSVKILQTYFACEEEGVDE